MGFFSGVSSHEHFLLMDPQVLIHVILQVLNNKIVYKEQRWKIGRKVKAEVVNLTILRICLSEGKRK